MNKAIFNPPSWCESYTFIVEFNRNGDHETSFAANEKELLKLIAANFTDDLTTLSVDAICCGHNQGEQDKRKRRQIKKVWNLDLK